MFKKDMTVGEVIEKHKVLPFSRIPIYDESADNIRGYVLRHEIYKRVASDEHDVKLEDIAREIHVVPETNSVAQVLNDFIIKQDHVFVVIDEYGGTAGLITLEDTVETLLGIEILDESDRVADLRELARRRYESQLDFLEQMERAESESSEPNEPEDKPTETTS
jgi:CBS domain containing-hemolysin-like protein